MLDPQPSASRATEPPPALRLKPPAPKPRVDVAAVRVAMARRGGRFKRTALRSLRER